MKARLTLFLLLILSTTLSAQKKKPLKYKDIFESVLNGPDIQAFQQLKDYQTQKPEENANVYFQLGKICHKWMRKFDPIKEIEDVEYFARHTEIYLGICQSKLTNQEVSSMQTYYLGVDLTTGSKKVKVEDVQQDIQRRLQDVALFKKKHQEMLLNFNNSLANYDKCIELFMDINRQNSNLKNLYLTADQAFRKKLQSLASTYDSALTYFKAYQAIVSDYPLGEYNPELKIEKIKTYRLQGLTSSNFLLNEVTFWDFGAWVREFSQTLDKDIARLRTEVSQTGNALNDRIAFFSNQSDYDDTWEGFTIPNKIAFHIHKWDYDSELLKLFRYQEAKLSFLKSSRMSLNTPSSELAFHQKAQYYQNLIAERNTLDSIHKATQGKFTSVGFARHRTYLTDKFGSLEGIKAYLQEEAAHNQRVLAMSIDNFKTFTVNSLRTQVNQPTPQFEWKKSMIATQMHTGSIDSLIFQSQPDSVNDGKYFTYDTQTATDGSRFITGFYKPTTRFAQAFIAKTVRTDSSETITWLKLLPRMSAVPNIGLKISPKANGCLLALTAVQDTLQNFILELDSLGELIQHDTVDSWQIPRFLQYDEINKELFMVYKGTAFTESLTGKESMDILLLDQNLKSRWAHQLALQGNFVDIIRSNNTFIAFGNYSGIELENKEWKTATSGSAIYSIKLPHSGKGRSTTLYTNQSEISLIKVVKNNSNALSLLGVKSRVAPLNTLLETPAQFYYSIINLDGKVMFVNK